jgi:6-phosphogluconate dehydrogenase
MVHNGIEYGDMQLICEVRSFCPTTPTALQQC